MRRVLILLLTTALAGAACSSSTVTSAPTAPTGASAVTEPSATAAATTAAVTTVAPTTTEPPPTAAPTTESPTTEPLTTEGTATAKTESPTDDTVPASRPFNVFVPTSYDKAKPTPLVLLLHGYSATGAVQEAYFGLQPLAEQRGFLYVHPDGTKDVRNNQFWNATNACCDFAGGIDDSGYLMSVIHQVERDYNVDRKRIFLIGHSNGGFMSYRMACDHADTIAAIVSMAGATFADTAKCKPSEPVSVLQIHGTSDQTIQYGGGDILGQRYPGAEATVATWAAYDRCGAKSVPSSKTLDIASQIAGAETSVATFPKCPSGVDVELWSVAGGSHVPALSATFASDAIDFLLSHPKQ